MLKVAMPLAIDQMLGVIEDEFAGKFELALAKG